MRLKELYEKVQLLKAGQVVEINADYFRAVRLNVDFVECCCHYCELDSICTGDVHAVCEEMDVLPSQHWILKLAHG